MSSTIRVLGDLSLTSSLVFETDFSGFPNNPAPRTLTWVQGVPYMYVEIIAGSGYYSWQPIGFGTTSYLFTQGVPSTTWTVVHNLGTTNFGYFVYDTNHNLQVANITVVDSNTARITLTNAIAGTAVFFSVRTVSLNTVFVANTLNLGTLALTANGSNVALDGTNLVTVNELAGINSSIASIIETQNNYTGSAVTSDQVTFLTNDIKVDGSGNTYMDATTSALVLKRKNASDVASYTGKQGEVVVNTTKNTLVVQDGSTAGGFTVALASDVTAAGSYANSAFASANNVAPQIAPAFNAANTAQSTATAAFVQANSAFAAANAAGSSATVVAAFNQANSAYAAANSEVKGTAAFVQANSAYAAANTASASGTASFVQANAAFGTANSAASYANSAFAAANAAGSSATVTAAFIQANAAYAKANSTLSTSGGTLSGDLTMTGNIIPSVAHTYSIGAQGNKFKSIYAEELYLGANTLYVDNVAVLGSTAETITFTANTNQGMQLQTFGTGQLILTSNASTVIQTTGQNGDVVVQASGLGSLARITSATQVTLTAPTVAITGNQTVSGDSTITGNLTINGTTTTVHSTNLQVDDNIIDLNKGETGTGVSKTYSGIQILRGDAPNVRMVWSELTKSFVMGPTGYEVQIADAPTMNAIAVAANTPSSVANTASSTATAAFNAANTAQSTATAAFNAANTSAGSSSSSGSYANSAFGVANTAASTATAAFIQANSAYSVANATSASLTSDLLLIASIDAAQNTAIAKAQGDATSAGSYANSAFAAANNVAPQIAPAFLQANSAYAAANTASASGTASFVQANAAFGTANSAASYANSAFGVANTAISDYSILNTTVTNLIFSQAGIDSTQNTNITSATSAATSAGSYANSAFSVANTVSASATAGLIQANAAYAYANTISTSGTVFANTAVAYANVMNEAAIVYTTSTTSQVAVDTFSSSTYRSAGYEIQMTSGSSYHRIQLAVIQDDTTVSMIQFGEIYTGSSLGVFDSSITGSTLSLLFTPTNAATTVRIVRRAMTV